jgi:hypothetical protein
VLTDVQVRAVWQEGSSMQLSLLGKFGRGTAAKEVTLVLTDVQVRALQQMAGLPA